MVCLVEVVLKPGKRSCPPLAMPAAGPDDRGAPPTPATPGWVVCRGNYTTAWDASVAQERVRNNINIHDPVATMDNNVILKAAIDAIADLTIKKFYRDFVGRPINIKLYKHEMHELEILKAALNYYEAEHGESELLKDIHDHADNALFNYINAFTEEIGGDGNHAAITEADSSREKAITDFSQLSDFQEFLNRALIDILILAPESYEDKTIHQSPTDAGLQEIITRQASDIKQKDSAIDKLSQRNEYLQEAVAKLETTLASFKTEIEGYSSLQQTVARQTTTLKHKNEEIFELDENKRRLQIALEEKESQITRLESKLDDLSSTKLAQDNKRLQGTIDRLNDKISSISPPRKEDQKVNDQMAGCLGALIAFPLALIIGVISGNLFVGMFVFAVALGVVLNMFESKK
jgi:myosin heavy subunit